MCARAEEFCIFALVFGEIVTMYRRAINDRPYVIHARLCDKLEFEAVYRKEKLLRVQLFWKR